MVKTGKEANLEDKFNNSLLNNIRFKMPGRNSSGHIIQAVKHSLETLRDLVGSITVNL